MIEKDLPACPVEITMGLIGDKWKVLDLLVEKYMQKSLLE